MGSTYSDTFGPEEKCRDIATVTVNNAFALYVQFPLENFVLFSLHQQKSFIVLFIQAGLFFPIKDGH